MTSSSKYILLVEDNLGDVLLVREALRDRAVDCDLHVVFDGEQAVKWIEQIDLDPALHCPKLLLLDLHLPKRDGEEILSCLRSSERCGQTAVVIMTSSDAPRDMESADRHAALHYFRKPASLEQFMNLGDIVKDIMSRDKSGKAG